MLQEILPILLKEEVKTLLISGDVSCTSLKAEFLQASHFVRSLEEHGIETLVIPGNHDNYTKKAYRKKTFYDFFPATPLAENQLLLKPLENDWHFLLLDTTLPTPLFCCHGEFSKDLGERLKKTLEALPKDAKVIVANHFPLNHPKDLSLKGGELLLSILKSFPQVKLYLHGHTHKRRFSDVENEGLPLIVDSGSAAHKFVGSWNIVECSTNKMRIQPYVWRHGKWALAKEKEVVL